METIDPFAENGSAAEKRAKPKGAEPSPHDIIAYLRYHWGDEAYETSAFHALQQAEASRTIKARPKKSK